MARFAVNLPSGRTDHEGFFRLLGKTLTGSGVLGTGHLAVSSQPTPDMNVRVAAGDVAIFSGSILYHGWSTAIETVTIPTNSSGVTKITAVVASIDTSAASTTANNPNGLVFQTVTLDGTDTSTPTDAQISTAIGGRPFARLANVTVANGATSINAGNIADARASASLAATMIPAVRFTNTPGAANQVTMTNATTGNSPVVEATGTDANIHLVARAKGNGLTKTSIARNDAGTVSYKHNMVILTGVTAAYSATGANEASGTITFGVTFANPPIVLTSLRDLTNWGNQTVDTSSITATNCIYSIRIMPNGLGHTNSTTYGGKVSWIAVGELA